MIDESLTWLYIFGKGGCLLYAGSRIINFEFWTGATFLKLFSQMSFQERPYLQSLLRFPSDPNNLVNFFCCADEVDLR